MEDVAGGSQILAVLNKKGNVLLLRETDTGRIAVTRQLSGGKAEVYRRLLGVQNPHLPLIYRVEEQANGGCTVYEQYVEGANLQQRLDAEGPLPQMEATQVLMQLCDALQALHSRGIVHRDVKPGNVMLTPQGKAVLIDFDIARTEKDGAAQDTALLGTQGYAAPEQFGFRQSDPRADIYAAGVLFHVLLTGKLPQQQTLKGAAAKIIAKCTALEPDARYADAAALRAALAELPQPETKPDTGPEKPAPIQKKKAGVRVPVRWLGRVPGFRSGKPLKIMLALLFYFFAVLFAVALLQQAAVSVQYFGISVGLLLLGVSWYLFLFDCFGLRMRLIPPEKSKTKQRYGLCCAAWLVGSLLAAFCFMVLFSLF